MPGAGYSETQCCSRSSQPLMMCHLSRPLDWKSRRSDLLSCNSKKNFSVSRPLAWLGSMDCVRSQRSHSWVIRIFASFCFIYTRPIYEPCRALVVALVLPKGAKRGGAIRHRLSHAPRTRDASAAFAAGDPRAVQSAKWLVGCTEVSGRRRADSSSIESEA